MRNHHEKRRDIARSALHTTREFSSRRDFRLAHKEFRSRERQFLHRVARSLDPDEVDPPEERRLVERIAEVRADRRYMDKLWPLFRWAGHTIAHDPKLLHQDQRGQAAHLSKRLGDSPAGRHAASHLRNMIIDGPGSLLPFRFHEYYVAPHLSDPAPRNTDLP